MAHIGVDDTSFRKRHDDVTIMSDSNTGTVLHVGKHRKKSSLSRWYARLTPAHLAQIKSVNMDIWPAYINSTLAHLPNADRKVAFDRYHVAKCLGAAWTRCGDKSTRRL